MTAGSRSGDTQQEGGHRSPPSQPVSPESDTVTEGPNAIRADQHRSLASADYTLKRGQSQVVSLILDPPKTESQQGGDHINTQLVSWLQFTYSRKLIR